MKLFPQKELGSLRGMIYLFYVMANIELKKAAGYRITLDDGSKVIARFTGNWDYEGNPIFNQHDLTRIVPIERVEICTKEEFVTQYLGRKAQKLETIVGADPAIQMQL